MSLSARRAWIEISMDDLEASITRSLSARRAWIEIKYVVKDSDFSGVALRKESVDRNSTVSASFRACITVALRKESVDRNEGKLDADLWVLWSLSARRAWIEIVMQEIAQQRKQSLSARRAWIEIIDYIIDYVNDASLSARRAWIEIVRGC